jgi:hypothetical protein
MRRVSPRLFRKIGSSRRNLTHFPRKGTGEYKEKLSGASGAFVRAGYFLRKLIVVIKPQHLYDLLSYLPETSL